MGVFNPDKHAKRVIKELTAEERKVTLPSMSNFAKEYNFLFIEDIDNK
jgi:hypothetical protein